MYLTSLSTKLTSLSPLQATPRHSSPEAPARTSRNAVSSTRTYKADQLKSKIQQNGTWSAAARQPSRLCHRPAVFSRHPPFHSRKEEFGWHLKIYFDFSLFIKICTCLKLQMCRSVGACAIGSCCWSVLTETSSSRLSGLRPTRGCFE